MSRGWVAIGLTVALVAGCSGGGSQRSKSTPTSTPSTAATASAGIHKIKHIVVIQQENRSFDSYFGTYPGANGIPMTAGKPSVCVPNPVTHACVTQYVDHADVNGGGPHSATNATADVDGGKMDGFVAQAQSGRRGCLDPTDPACTNSPTPDVMGYHTASDIPNYWSYASNYVLQDDMFEPNASWSLPSHLFLVSEWSADCTQHNNPSSCQNALQTRPRDRPPNAPAVYGGATRNKPIYAWTDLTYLLYKAHVSWGYYVVSGTEPDCENDAAESCAPVRQSRAHAGDLESAALLRHREGRQPARQHPIGRQLLYGGEARNAAGRLVGRPVG